MSYLNQIDTGYRSELRELNEPNFARFDAKLERRVAELRAEFKQGIAELRMEVKQELAELRAELHKGIAALPAEFVQENAEMRGNLRIEFNKALASLETKLIRWMFVFWAGSTLTMLGTMSALLNG